MTRRLYSAAKNWGKFSQAGSQEGWGSPFGRRALCLSSPIARHWAARSCWMCIPLHPTAENQHDGWLVFSSSRVVCLPAPVLRTCVGRDWQVSFAALAAVHRHRLRTDDAVARNGSRHHGFAKQWEASNLIFFDSVGCPNSWHVSFEIPCGCHLIYLPHRRPGCRRPPSRRHRLPPPTAHHLFLLSCWPAASGCVSARLAHAIRRLFRQSERGWWLLQHMF